jgi:hypothetical protein
LENHKDREVTFSLVVDDFGIKYRIKADPQHLIDVLNKMYRTKED